MGIITSADIDSLEFQTDQAFEAFKRAVRTEAGPDIAWAKVLYEGIAFALSNVAGPDFLQWRMYDDNRRVETFKRILLQYALGSCADDLVMIAPKIVGGNDERLAVQLPELSDAWQEFKGVLSWDPCKAPLREIEKYRNRSFADLKEMAGKLASSGKTSVIISGLEYVRKNVERQHIISADV